MENAQLKQITYSIAAYRAMERDSLEKMEYHHGEVFAMVGGSFMHGLLSGNAIGGLRDAIRKSKKPCF